MNSLTQGRVLRVLQEKQVMRIGDNKVTPVDIRVIAATNRNLYQLVLDKKFRRDLFYRLNILKIEMPSLRDKKEDIPFLINHFIEYYSRKLGRPKLTINKDAIEYISSYEWPGNIRELRNFTERLMVISKTREVKLQDVKNRLIKLDTTWTSEKKENIGKQVVNFSIKESEGEKIVRILNNNDFKINDSALELGISRTTLWRKMKKFGITIDCETEMKQM